MATSSKNKNSRPILGRELAHAVPPRLCPDPEDPITYLFGLITGPTVSLTGGQTLCLLLPFRFWLAGGFQRVCRSRLSIHDLLSLLASGPLTRPGHRLVFRAVIICRINCLSSITVSGRKAFPNPDSCSLCIPRIDMMKHIHYNAAIKEKLNGLSGHSAPQYL
jgi:hypothetical protein